MSTAIRYPFGTDARLIIEDGQLDIDTTFAVETDPGRVLVGDLAKIVTTLAGTLWWAPTATEDATQGLNDAMSQDRAAAFRGRLQSAVQQDSRYTDVVVSLQQIGRTLTISITATAGNRNLVLVLVTNDNGTLSVQEAAVDGSVL